MVTDPDSADDTSQRNLLKIDLNAWPCGSYGTLRFDVPPVPFGTLKKTLRTFLHRFVDVEAAYMLFASQPEWGDASHITIPLVTECDIDSVYRTWKAERPDDPPIWFLRVGNNPISAFARSYTVPFYVREGSKLPAPFTSAELVDLIQSVPEIPHLAPTSKYLESLKETYDDLPPEEAASKYRAQSLEMEGLLEEFRTKSTHGAAKKALLQCLLDDGPFSLLLRTFEREVVSGTSLLTSGVARLWLLDRPLERHIAQVTPLQLIGIANPVDPFPSSDYLQLEVAEDWPRVVVSLVTRAAAIFVICDRLSPGVVTELLAIQGMGREDDTFIIVPAADTSEQYKMCHFFQGPSNVAPLDPAVLKRKLATFGVTATSKEFMEMPRYER
jgi:hypothetical protein